MRLENANVGTLPEGTLDGCVFWNHSDGTSTRVRIPMIQGKSGPLHQAIDYPPLPFTLPGDGDIKQVSARYGTFYAPPMSTIKKPPGATAPYRVCMRRSLDGASSSVAAKWFLPAIQNVSGVTVLDPTITSAIKDVNVLSADSWLIVVVPPDYQGDNIDDKPVFDRFTIVNASGSNLAPAFAYTGALFTCMCYRLDSEGNTYFCNYARNTPSAGYTASAVAIYSM